MLRTLALLAVLLPALARAGDRVVATLADERGDDHGAGTLAYPQRDGFAPGDLDLTTLRIVRTDAGYRFEASFRNAVRDPATVAGAAGPESLDYFARRGFYAFNVDLYLDLDRVRGSGNTWTLPGRGVRIDESHAWDKAVVLTPRPELMRRQLIDALAGDEGAPDDRAATARVDGLLHFATDVRVRGRTVAFGVPAGFLAGARPDTGWSLVAAVTGGKVTVEAELDLARADGSALERLALGAMQPRPGRPRETFGYPGTVPPPAVVDLLAAGAQQTLLAGPLPLQGLTWSAAGAEPGAGRGTAATRLSRSAPASATAATPAAPEPARGDIAARLRRLDALRAEGLVSDAEYQAQRRRILEEL